MAGEVAMWQYMRDKMVPRELYFERHTERLIAGVLDVWWLHPASGLSGWLELKARAKATHAWEVRREQVLQMQKLQRFNGRACLLGRTGRDVWSLWYPRQALTWNTAMLSLTAGEQPQPDKVWTSWPGTGLAEYLAVQPKSWAELPFRTGS